MLERNGSGPFRTLSPSPDLCGAARQTGLSLQAHNLGLDGRPVWRDEPALKTLVVDGGSLPIPFGMNLVTVS